MIGQTSPTAFQFLYMTLAVNITGHGLSKAYCELLPKEYSKVILYSLFVTC